MIPDVTRHVPGPWPPLAHVAPFSGDYDPPGPLVLAVLLPLLGAFVALALPARWARIAVRVGALWTVPGALFLIAAVWFGGTGQPGDVRWLERLPGGGGLVLSIWNLVPALALGITAPVALLLPEARDWEPARTGWLLVFVAACQSALLAAGPGVAALGWLAGTWALFFLLGHQDAAGQGARAVGPFVAHATASTAVFVASLAPTFLPLLVLAGVVRMGMAPFHGLLARTFETLPVGALLLLGIGFLTTGLRAVHDGLLAVTRAGSPVDEGVVLASAAAALWAGLLALSQDDVKRRLAGFLSAQAAVWCGLLAALEPDRGRAVVGSWALVTLLAFLTLVVGYARLWAFTRTSDLRAYGGLLRHALVRSVLLVLALAALVLAPLLAARGLALQALAGLVFERPLEGLALTLGWALGLLAIGLAVYRTIRGTPPGPVAAPDLSPREWGFACALGALLFFLAELRPPLGGLGGLWPVLLAGTTP